MAAFDAISLGSYPRAVKVELDEVVYATGGIDIDLPGVLEADDDIFGAFIPGSPYVPVVNLTHDDEGFNRRVHVTLYGDDGSGGFGEIPNGTSLSGKMYIYITQYL